MLHKIRIYANYSYLEWNIGSYHSPFLQKRFVLKSLSSMELKYIYIYIFRFKKTQEHDTRKKNLTRLKKNSRHVFFSKKNNSYIENKLKLLKIKNNKSYKISNLKSSSYQMMEEPT